jgi:hypothetical protein
VRERIARGFRVSEDERRRSRGSLTSSTRWSARGTSRVLHTFPQEVATDAENM